MEDAPETLLSDQNPEPGHSFVRTTLLQPRFLRALNGAEGSEFRLSRQASVRDDFRKLRCTFVCRFGSCLFSIVMASRDGVSSGGQIPDDIGSTATCFSQRYCTP